jgi:hypothetical protein
VKMMSVELTTEEWRKLRRWAAQEDTSVQAVIGKILRRELEKLPSLGY